MDTYCLIVFSGIWHSLAQEIIAQRGASDTDSAVRDLCWLVHCSRVAPMSPKTRTAKRQRRKAADSNGGGAASADALPLPAAAPAPLEDVADLPEALVKHLKNVCVCTVCGPNDRFTGRSHSSRSGHPWRGLNAAERTEEITWWREIKEEGEPARLKILQKRREDSRQGTRADMPSCAVVPKAGWDFVLDFGKHRAQLEIRYGTNKGPQPPPYRLGYCG